MTYTFGIELEISGLSQQETRSGLLNRNIKGFKVVNDDSHGVTAEIVSCPMAYGMDAMEQINKVSNALQDMGATIMSNCGFHVHISNAPLMNGVDANDWTRKSIEHFENTGNYYSENLSDPMDAVLIKDVMYRYTKMQNGYNGINSMLPRSRRDMTMARVLVLESIEAANTIRELQNATHGKFSTINLQPWTTHGTIEFRQAAGTIEADKILHWIRFLLNLIDHSENYRIDQSASREIHHETPTQPFRRGARVGVQYTMMRAVDGATTRQIMNATGCSEQRVRAAVSEIRTRVGEAAVVTHTQQANGASYGQGTDLTRYQVQCFYNETITGGAALLPDTRIGNPSIWANLDDSDYEFWMGRIQALDR